MRRENINHIAYQVARNYESLPINYSYTVKSEHTSWVPFGKEKPE
jgi:hypothetical protein